MERIAMATASPRIPFTYRYGNVGWRSKLYREREREKERGREREKKRERYVYGKKERRSYIG